eukprot:m.324528 g.324528  ORF g.324528 m.324528 type:complete len:60 (+) comp16010_c2_seq1:313-492(+)
MRQFYILASWFRALLSYRVFLIVGAFFVEGSFLFAVSIWVRCVCVFLFVFCKIVAIFSL